MVESALHSVNKCIADYLYFPVRACVCVASHTFCSHLTHHCLLFQDEPHSIGRVAPRYDQMGLDLIRLQPVHISI